RDLEGVADAQAVEADPRLALVVEHAVAGVGQRDHARVADLLDAAVGPAHARAADLDVALLGVVDHALHALSADPAVVEHADDAVIEALAEAVGEHAHGRAREQDAGVLALPGRRHRELGEGLEVDAVAG